MNQYAQQGTKTRGTRFGTRLRNSRPQSSSLLRVVNKVKGLGSRMEIAFSLLSHMTAVTRIRKITRRCMDKKNFSTFSYKLVQISPIVILINSGAFLSISSWFCELTNNAKDYGYVQVAN